MRIRRHALTVAVVASLAAGSVAAPVAQAQPVQSQQLTKSSKDSSLSSGSSKGSSNVDSSTELSSKTGLDELSSNSETSSKSKAWFDGLNPVMQFIVGVAAASAFFTLAGMARTLVYNIAGL